MDRDAIFGMSEPIEKEHRSHHQDILEQNHERVLTLWRSGADNDQVALECGVKKTAVDAYEFKLSGGAIGREARLAKKAGKEIRKALRKGHSAASG
jgi:hypothetical protein